MIARATKSTPPIQRIRDWPIGQSHCLFWQIFFPYPIAADTEATAPLDDLTGKLVQILPAEVSIAEIADRPRTFRRGGKSLGLVKEARDLDEGIRWLKQAAENGNHFATYRLGKEYLEENTVSKDTTRAADWSQSQRRRETNTPSMRWANCT